MRREEDSEEEVFERRRKIQKKEVDEREKKEGIEHLFTEESSESFSEEEAQEEKAQWGLRTASMAGVLFDIFGDGTEYGHVLEALSGRAQAARSSASSSAQRAEESSSHGHKHKHRAEAGQQEGKEEEEAHKDAVKGEERRKLLKQAQRMFPGLPEEELGVLADSALGREERKDALQQALPYIDSLHEQTVLLQMSRLVEQSQAARPLRARSLQVLQKMAGLGAEVQSVHKALDTLFTSEEYARLLRWAELSQVSPQELEITEAIGGPALSCIIQARQTSSVLDATTNNTNTTSTNTNSTSTTWSSGHAASSHTKGGCGMSLCNPWIYQTALQAALDTHTLSVRTSTEKEAVLLSTYFPTTPLVLSALEKRGVATEVVLDTEKLVQSMLQQIKQRQQETDSGIQTDSSIQTAEEKRQNSRDGLGIIPSGSSPTAFGLSVDTEKALHAFAENALSELKRSVRREIQQRASAHIQSTLFERVLALASTKCTRHSVQGVHVARGQIRYTCVDTHGDRTGGGVHTGPDALQEGEKCVCALTGAGVKLRPFFRKSTCVYVPEELLSLGSTGADLSGALCAFVQRPLPALQKALSSEKALPALVSLESFLPPRTVRCVWKHAVDYARAQKELQSSSAYCALRKNLLEYLKSGGNIQAVGVSVGARVEDVLRAVKETAAPHTMLRGPVEESAVHSPILRMAYRGCMHRLKGLPFLPASLSVREEFLAAAGIAEAELFALETCWPLSSVCEISLPGKTMSATVCKTYPECTVQLENRMFAALSLPGPGGRGLFDVGQAMQVQVQSVDLAQQRVVVLPTEKSGERTLRALSDGRVKQVSAAGALRLLKEKPLGAYVLRLSATHKDSLVLTLRMTDYPDECICAHLRVKECADGYELCGAMYATLASVVSSFVPAYTKVLQRVHTHQRFSMCALEEIKEAAARRAVPCAFSVSRTAHGCISFVHASADPSSSPEEVLFFVTDRGLVHGGKIFPTPESVCAAYKISPA